MSISGDHSYTIRTALLGLLLGWMVERWTDTGEPCHPDVTVHKIPVPYEEPVKIHPVFSPPQPEPDHLPWWGTIPMEETL